MRNTKTSMLASLMASSVCLLLMIGGCSAGTDDPCLNKSTFIGKTGARPIMDIPLDVTPGVVAAIHTQDGVPQMSRSSRLAVDSTGSVLYAAHGSTVWAIDLATLERRPFARLPGRASQIATAHPETALLVSDQETGTVHIVDEDRTSEPTAVPAGQGPSGLALAPGHRLAYVANELDRSLTLVETGMGYAPASDTRLVVADRYAGVVLLLDHDGRPVDRFDDLPFRIRDLELLPDGESVVGTYSAIVCSGSLEVTGDCAVSLSEGLFTLDLATGEHRTWPLDAPPAPELAGRLARPTGLTLLPGGRTLAVALPGWSRVGIVDLESGAGQVARYHLVPGRPEWLAATPEAGGELWVLDADQGTLRALPGSGPVGPAISLR